MAATRQSDAHASLAEEALTPTASANPSEPTGPKVQEPYKLSRTRFVLIFLSIMLMVFLFALDQLIVVTAIPKITTQFHSLTQISWISNGFFLTLLAFNLAFAQWTMIFPAKHACLFAITIFEIGSLLCGVAPNMTILILGRAIAGIGGSGIFNSALMLITEMTTMAERARLMGFFGVVFAVASVTGPLIGGAVTDHASWRWCFYINLPIGGFACALIVILVPTRAPYGRADTYKGYGWHMLHQLLACDWVGIAIILGWGCVSILVMQEGGVTKNWKNASIIVMFILIPILPAVFIAWEFYMGPNAMMPIRVFKRPVVICAAVISCCIQAPFVSLAQYLAEGYQALYHTSATRAGILLLPMIIVNVAVLITAGRILARFGRPWPLMLTGPAIICIGSGLLYSVKATDSKSYPMGYSAFLGFGCGLVLQNVIILAQYEFRNEPQYVTLGTGAITFCGFIGRLYGIGIGGSVFENMIPVNITKYAPTLSPEITTQVRDNALAVWTSVPDDLRPAVLEAYTKTLGAVYLIGVPWAAIALIAALFLGNIKMDMRLSHGRAPPADVEAPAEGAKHAANAEPLMIPSEGAVAEAQAIEMEQLEVDKEKGKGKQE
ncbi:MFS general substrate transporter [Clavulina sp. PMI_390]|nr:MFS general substrate transporter [Clavulina sp. PMI_390]